MRIAATESRFCVAAVDVVGVAVVVDVVGVDVVGVDVVGVDVVVDVEMSEMVLINILVITLSACLFVCYICIQKYS